MQGKILDFSIQTNSGIISGDDQKRYSFAGSEWKEQQLPKRGMLVDFDIDTQGQAIGVYTALAGSGSNNVIVQFQEKTETQYSAFDWFLKALKHYIDFSGRARRKEFWFFMLFNMLGCLAALIFDEVFGTEIIFYVIYILAMALPVLAVSIRRLHDLGKSGWWYLLSLIPLVGMIILIIWFTKEGDAHANLYGQPAK